MEPEDLAAAQSAVDAIAYSLRAGVGALSRRDVQDRIAALDEQQLHEVAARAETFNPEIAPPWRADDIRRLVESWTQCHAG
jgi:hypothetical protein